MFRKEIESFLLALDSYARYLDVANEKQTCRQSQTHPARELARNVHVFYSEVTEDQGHSSLYSKLENAMPSEEYVLIFFDEENHLVSPFKNRMERVRSFENIKLSFPIQMIRFDPGGNKSSVNVL